MRVILIDIDTLRPDHLGCYGYHRNTSPNIDEIAKDSVRFEQCFSSDTPCLPSRAAFHHGQFGIHNGAINHGGAYADPFPNGHNRGWNTTQGKEKWMEVLRRLGVYTTSVTSYAARHGAWWFLADFNEVYDCGKGGNEIATDIIDKSLEFLDKHKDTEDWFFHINMWDPHTPYRIPEKYGNPFENNPPPQWMTQEIIDKHQTLYGTHSANAVQHNPEKSPLPREVSQIKNLEDYKKWVDGYDVGIRYADDAVGKIIEKLKEQGLYEETAIIITSDHGENQGELNIYGDHQTADLVTNRVPMIIKWPGVKPYTDKSFHYQFDVSATVIELFGGGVPEKWDGISFKDAFLNRKENGRDFLVLSHAPWSCQRSVVFEDYILIKSYMDGLKEFPKYMLFNWRNDIHELFDLSEQMPEIVEKGKQILEQWTKDMLSTSEYHDPMQGVIDEGGPWHTRGRLQMYIDYYNKIGKPEIAKRMHEKYKNIQGY